MANKDVNESYRIPDSLWEQIEPLLPPELPKPRGGRPFSPPTLDETDGTTHWGVWVGIGHSGGWNSADLGSAVEGGYTPGTGIDLSFEENRWDTVRFENEGNHYRMFLDGKLVLEDDAGSPEHTYGVAGFALRNCEVRFDNVIIKGDSIPDRNVAAVSLKSKLATTWGNIKK